MTWPFENDTSAITKKLANKSLKSEKRRNLMVVIAVALAAFLMLWKGSLVATMNFSGKYQLQSQENFEPFMKAIGEW